MLGALETRHMKAVCDRSMSLLRISSVHASRSWTSIGISPTNSSRRMQAAAADPGGVHDSSFQKNSTV